MKMHVVQVVSVQSVAELGIATVSSDDQCDLGKWLYSSASRHACMSVYKTLRLSHAAVYLALSVKVRRMQPHKSELAKIMLGVISVIAQNSQLMLSAPCIASSTPKPSNPW